MARSLFAAALFIFPRTVNSFAATASLPLDSLPVVTIQLETQDVPVIRQNRTLMNKTSYFGTIFVGGPVSQNFTVVFDTGSGHVILPSLDCTSHTCLLHRRYDSSLSSTAVDINKAGVVVAPDALVRDEVEIVYGTGEASGQFVKEQLCFSPHGPEDWQSAAVPADCVEVRTVLANQMTEEPFSLFDFDGVVGLGFEALAVAPAFSFLGQLTRLRPGLQPVFGFFVSSSEDVRSEISFGGHDPRRTAAALRWTDVWEPELGHWQVQIRRVTVGGLPFQPCEDGKCVGIIDTGTSLLGVPGQATKELKRQLARTSRVSGSGRDEYQDVDCRAVPGPELVFELDGLTLTLGSEDYSRPAATHVFNETSNSSLVVCLATLLPVHMGPPMGPKTFVLGQPLMRKYYTAYDWGARRVGFAPVAAHGATTHVLEQATAAGEEAAVWDRLPEQYT